MSKGRETAVQWGGCRSYRFYYRDPKTHRWTIGSDRIYRLSAHYDAWVYRRTGMIPSGARP